MSLPVWFQEWCYKQQSPRVFAQTERWRLQLAALREKLKLVDPSHSVRPQAALAFLYQNHVIEFSVPLTHGSLEPVTHCLPRKERPSMDQFLPKLLSLLPEAVNGSFELFLEPLEQFNAMTVAAAHTHLIQCKTYWESPRFPSPGPPRHRPRGYSATTGVVRFSEGPHGPDRMSTNAFRRDAFLDIAENKGTLPPMSREADEVSQIRRDAHKELEASRSHARQNLMRLLGMGADSSDSSRLSPLTIALVGLLDAAGYQATEEKETESIAQVLSECCMQTPPVCQRQVRDTLKETQIEKLKRVGFQL